MSERADVVIAGAGIVGAACAYWLTRHGFKGRILMVEKDLGFQFASTGRSAGGLRQQFSGRENIALSQFTLALIRRLKEEFGPEADVGFKEQGYAILATEKGVPILTRNIAVQQQAGASVAFHDAQALGKLFPWMQTEGLAGGSFSTQGEGWLDAHGWMNLLRKAARAQGAELIGDEVSAITVEKGRVAEVQLASGRHIACGTFINAAGSDGGRVAALAGLHLPVEPRKRYIYVLDCRDAPESLSQAPLTVDPGGVWFRPEGRTFICGKSPAEDAEPATGDFEVDHDFFENEIWPELAYRVPAFEAIKVVNSWAGYYDYNTFDQNGIIGPHPEVTNFFFANGFSGHGLQQGAGVGHAISEMIVKGRSQTLDVAQLGYERIARGHSYAELNII